VIKIKVKYIGNMGSGKIHTNEGAIYCKRGEEVTVTKSQFKEIVPAGDWVGVYPKKKKTLKELEGEIT